MPHHNPTSHLLRVRTLLSGAAVSLEHCLAAETDASRDCRVEQQSPFILEEIDHAIEQLVAAREAMSGPAELLAEAA